MQHKDACEECSTAEQALSWEGWAKRSVVVSTVSLFDKLGLTLRENCADSKEQGLFSWHTLKEIASSLCSRHWSVMVKNRESLRDCLAHAPSIWHAYCALLLSRDSKDFQSYHSSPQWVLKSFTIWDAALCNYKEAAPLPQVLQWKG